MRVFVTHDPEDLEAYFGRALPELSAIAEVVHNPLGHDLTTPELVEAASDCEVIVAHRSTPGEPDLFARLPRLVAFLRTAVDISTIDLDAASSAGVVVGHADKSFVASTAELALGLYLDLSRHISASSHDYWSHVEPPQRGGRQIRGQTAGIIGFGAIGSYLAELLSALGVKVIVADPVAAIPDRFESTAMTELLQRSDVVFPLTPGGSATTGLIGAAELAAMPPGALLVNVSRGEVLDDAAVETALDSGRLGGLGLDVGRAADQRPMMSLAQRADVVATPHLGGLTPENADAQAASSVEQVAAMLGGRMPPRVVNEGSATRLRDWWARR